MFEIKYANKPDKLEHALKELNKIRVIDKNLHEFNAETLGDYSGEIEMVGEIKIGDQTRPTNMRFRNIDRYESYINTIDQDYDSDDSIFNGYIYKINTPQIKLVKRNQCGNGCDFKQQIIEDRGNKCFIPIKS